jgi:DNA-binding CsgD family transcriptional regulator
MGAEHAARPGDTEEVFLDSRTPASSLFVHRNMIRHQLTRFPAELTNEPDNRSCEDPSISEVIHEGAEVLDQETGFAERAARELRATGERVGKRTTDTPDQLTARETQIARLAGEGLSNPEIAAQLFMSPRTVEYHLHKVFNKLKIRSRNQLRVLATRRNQPRSPNH